MNVTAVRSENATDDNTYGIYANAGLEVSEKANLIVNIKVPALQSRDYYAVYVNGGGIYFSGTGSKTITCDVYNADEAFGVYALYNAAKNPTTLTDTGDISITGTGKTTIKASPLGAAVQSDINGRKNTDGVITIEDTEVEITGGWCGIMNMSTERESAAADVIVKNSKLTMTGVTKGICSAFNGIELNNSEVSVTASLNAVDLNKAKASTSYNNSTYGLHVSGSKPVTLTSTGDSAIELSSGVARTNPIDFTSGGKLTAQNTAETLPLIDGTFLVNFGEKTALTKGTYTDGSGVRPVTEDGKNIFVIEYKEPATVESIAVSSTNHKTAYQVGDALDVTNLKIKATMSDTTAKTVDVTADMVTGFDSTSAADSQTLTITYEGKTTTYNISISNAPTPKAEFRNAYTISGTVGTALDPSWKKVSFALSYDSFTTTPSVNDDVSAWFTNKPNGVVAKVKEWDSSMQELTIAFSGTPTEPKNEDIVLTIPGDKLTSGNPLTVDAHYSAGASKWQIVSPYWAEIHGNLVVSGTTGTKYTGSVYTDKFKVWLKGSGDDRFTNVAADNDVSSWITNLPSGLTAKIVDNYESYVEIMFEGTPTTAVTGPIQVTIPAANQTKNNEDLVATVNENVKFNITSSGGGTPLTFADSTDYDIPAGTKDVTYTATTALTATGGTAPYTFRVDPAVNGLSINSENKLVYTRPAVQDATTATIKVTDSASASQTITIDIGAVEAPAAPKTLSSIEVTTPPTKTTYTAGENFDPAGMEVTATYSDGSTQDVTSSVTVSGGNSLTTDKTSVTISYTEGEVTKTTTQNITVKAPAKTLSSIAVTTAPTKTTYTAGENFDPAGMVVTATYSDGSTQDVTSSVTVSDGNSLTTDKTSVTISYTEGEVTKTTTQAITVNAPAKTLSSIAVTTPPTKTTYTAGENFDSAGMVVTATYSDGSTNVVTATVTDGNALTAGKTSVTISYTEGEVTKTTTQAITVNEGSSVTPPAPPASGGGSGFSGKYNYPVVIDTDDHATAKADKNHAVAGDKVTITISPEAGYAVDEVIITDKDNKVITASKAGDNTYSFTMPEGKVKVAVTTEKATYSLKLVLQIGNKNIVANGKPFAYDTAPIIDANSRTLVPIRVITEQLGGQVDWNEKLQTVTLKLDGKMYVMTIGQTIPGFDTAAIIDENGRTLVPVRYVAEKLGARVDWIAATQQVVITK